VLHAAVLRQVAPAKDSATMNVKHPNLQQLMGAKVVIETREGAIQVGKVSKINYIETQLLGETVQTPTSIEMNNDPSEFADWTRIASIKRHP